MEKCSKSPECRIYTVIDKKKENSMILCITVNDTQSCYAHSCSCQRNRQKRAVNTHQVSTHPKENPNLIRNNYIPAQCNISIDNRDYFTTSYSVNSDASMGHSDDTTSILICDRNVEEKGKVQ